MSGIVLILALGLLGFVEGFAFQKRYRSAVERPPRQAATWAGVVTSLRCGWLVLGVSAVMSENLWAVGSYIVAAIVGTWFAVKRKAAPT